jgi:hypothetical protein
MPEITYRYLENNEVLYEVNTYNYRILPELIEEDIQSLRSVDSGLFGSSVSLRDVAQSMGLSDDKLTNETIKTYQEKDVIAPTMDKLREYMKAEVLIKLCYEQFLNESEKHKFTIEFDFPRDVGNQQVDDEDMD